MKKVLFVTHSLGYGGAERSLVNLLNELPRDEYEVDLLLFQKKGDFLAQVPGWVRVLDTPPAIDGLYAPVKKAGKELPTKLLGTLLSKLARPTRKSRAAFRWRHFYRKRMEPLPGHYDVAVAYVGSEIMYFVRDLVSADRKLVWIHNDYRTAGYSKADDLPYFADMDAIVSVSRECVDVLKEEFPQYASKMHYIENITSSCVVRKQAEAYFPEEYAACPCNILSIGRLMPQKGFDLAVEAAAIMKQKGLNFRWFIVGTGELKEKLEQQAKTLGVEDRFLLLGTRANPYPYIKNCTLLAQTSRYEGKSVVLDEAKILCAPILATAYPTVADQVRDGKEGIITPMSPAAIAEGIVTLLSDEDLRSDIQEYLRGQEYGNQSEVAKYRKVIDEK